MSKQTLRIGTRSSQLALWQANWVKSCLEERYPGLEVTLTKIKTQGDKILDVPLAMVGGKGLFVKEIEEAMLRGEVDIAVHSMKDVPTIFPEGLDLRCITRREDPRDIVVLRSGLSSWRDIPQGGRIGTSSLRRKSQLLHLRPDLEMRDIRGTVETRIRKLTEDNLDAVVLAAAGMKRLGFADQVGEYLEPEVSLPAIGQGALGLETRIDDERTNEMIDFFHHPETAYAVTAERQRRYGQSYRAGGQCRRGAVSQEDPQRPHCRSCSVGHRPGRGSAGNGRRRNPQRSLPARNLQQRP
jgi:hydroxymethylbilane synthase